MNTSQKRLAAMLNNAVRQHDPSGLLEGRLRVQSLDEALRIVGTAVESRGYTLAPTSAALGGDDGSTMLTVRANGTDVDGVVMRLDWYIRRGGFDLWASF